MQKLGEKDSEGFTYIGPEIAKQNAGKMWTKRPELIAQLPKVKQVFNKKEETLIIEGETFKVTSKVRNELDGSRQLHNPQQVINCTPGPKGGARKPYMPRPFPSGVWNILSVRHSTDPNYIPVIVETDAHQTLPIWALDAKGGYDHATDEMVEDYGYWFHHAWFKNGNVWQASSTTHGCANIINEKDCERIFELLSTGDKIEVI